MPGLRAVLLVVFAMTLTVCALPIWAVAFPLEGDYSETETVEYKVSKETIELEVPTTTTLGIHKDIIFMSWRFITPDDPAVQKIAFAIRDSVDYSDPRDLASEVLKWVQINITYCSDQAAHGVREYWQLPCETLRLGTGDCEDTSILLVSLWTALGFDAVIIWTPTHAATAVAVEVEPGDYTVEHNGKTYVTAETTNRRDLGFNRATSDWIIGSSVNAGQVLFWICDMIFTLLLVMGIVTVVRE